MTTRLRVLGITADFDIGAALVEEGRLVAAVNEERLCRMKLALGFPRGAIRDVLRLAGVEPGDVDAVLVSTRDNHLADALAPFEGWFENPRAGPAGAFRRLAGRAARYRDALPFLEAGYYALQAPAFGRRRALVRRILRRELGVRCPIGFVDHHLAHAASALHTSGFRDALVLTLDGGGDRRSSRVYAARNGELRPLHEVAAYHSLGNWYAYVTHLCGFRAHRHEGKITGLAAHGEPRHLDLLRSFIDERDGTFVNRGRVAFTAALEALGRALPSGWRREDLAASIQRHFEETVSRYVAHWARRAGLGDVAVAGGVFANVRVNQAVHERPEVERLFVHPGMGDGGLAVGAALAACVPGVLPRTMPADAEPLRDVYLGPDVHRPEIERALAEAGLRPEALGGGERAGGLEREIARLLADGYVVARVAGRMEYGPRALGNRSILYQPADASVNDWLNRKLRRTEFMPFAPSVLYEERHRCFPRTEGAEHAAEFMTLTFDCSPWMREHMAGVVHLDHTARPQLVRADRNAGYHAILRRFREITGLPGVVNTSFNIHEEPIVCDAADGVRAFLDAGLDYLAIGPFLVRHPAGATHPLRPVRTALRAGTGQSVPAAAGDG